MIVAGKIQFRSFCLSDWTCVFVCLQIVNLFNMSDLNVFSLKDDDCPEFFITQESSEPLVNLMNTEDEGCTSVFGIDGCDFTSPNVSVVQGLNAVYSDISDAEDFEKEKENSRSV